MKYIAAIIAFVCLTFVTQSFAGGGDAYASYWSCSNDQDYGLIANGNKREFYLPTGRAPLFFSGEKRGCSYEGWIHEGGQRFWVSGPISNQSTRVTLRARDGRVWVFNFRTRGY